MIENIKVTEETLSNVMVDTDTGEILARLEEEEIGRMSPSYFETVPYVHNKKYFRNLNLGELKSIKQVEAMMDLVDRRTLILENDVENIFNEFAGRAIRKGHTPSISGRQFNILKKLVESLTYRNFIICKTKELAEILSTTSNNVKQELSVVEDYIYIEEGVKHGEIKVWVSPAYGFKYQGSMLKASREQAIKNWYVKGC